MDAETGYIFDIQHFSLHDGPGVRSTVFFKGCPLSCRWCSNPESQSREPQLLHFANACKGCGLCLAACPNGALFQDEEGGTIGRRKDACALCGACARACPHDARQLSGRRASVAEVAAEVRQHWRIFTQSGGGVTLGGGEVLAQPRFLKALLATLHDELGFHTCIETSGHAPWPVMEAILPFLDLVLLDIKHVDDRRHREATGRSNGSILANARELARRPVPVVVRVPLVPGFNDGAADLHALAAFMGEAGLRAVEILPYHEFGISKYEALGRSYTVHSHEKPRTDLARAVLSGRGLSVIAPETVQT